MLFLLSSFFLLFFETYLVIQSLVSAFFFFLRGDGSELHKFFAHANCFFVHLLLTWFALFFNLFETWLALFLRILSFFFHISVYDSLDWLLHWCHLIQKMSLDIDFFLITLFHYCIFNPYYPNFELFDKNLRFGVFLSVDKYFTFKNSIKYVIMFQGPKY